MSCSADARFLRRAVSRRALTERSGRWSVSLRTLVLAAALLPIAVHSSVRLMAILPALEMWCVSNEARAIATLRKIASLEQQVRYRPVKKTTKSCGWYLDMSEHRRRMVLEDDLGGGIQHGYRYDLRIDREGWSCTATPVAPLSRSCTLFADSSGLAAAGNHPAHQHHVTIP